MPNPTHTPRSAELKLPLPDFSAFDAEEPTAPSVLTTAKEVQDLFPEVSNNPFAISDEVRKPLNHYHFSVFPIQALPTAIAAQNPSAAKKDDDVFADPADARVLRFIVSTSKQMLLGREGAPSYKMKTPAHRDMLGPNHESPCLTAGNLFYDENNQVYKINHKSGAYRPSTASLIWALAILVAVKPESLADQLTIEFLSERGGHEQDYIVSKPVLIAAINNLFSKEALANLTAKNQNTVATSYLQEQQPRRHSSASTAVVPQTPSRKRPGSSSAQQGGATQHGSPLKNITSSYNTKRPRADLQSFWQTAKTAKNDGGSTLTSSASTTASVPVTP